MNPTTERDWRYCGRINLGGDLLDQKDHLLFGHSPIHLNCSIFTSLPMSILIVQPDSLDRHVITYSSQVLSLRSVDVDIFEVKILSTSLRMLVWIFNESLQKANSEGPTLFAFAWLDTHFILPLIKSMLTLNDKLIFWGAWITVITERSMVILFQIFWTFNSYSIRDEDCKPDHPKKKLILN